MIDELFGKLSWATEVGQVEAATRQVGPAKAALNHFWCKRISSTENVSQKTWPDNKTLDLTMQFLVQNHFREVLFCKKT